MHTLRLILKATFGLLTLCLLLTAIAEGAFTNPDDEVLAFASETRAGFNLVLIHSDGEAQIVAQGVGGVSHISWSPLKDALLYTSEPHLYRYDVGSGETRNLTEAREFMHHSAAWSPNGWRIAYLITGGYFPSLSIMAVDGSDSQRVGTWTIHGARPPLWSPDGSHLLFLAMGEFSIDVIITDADGTNPRNLTADTALNDDAAWSPDGREVAFMSRTQPYNTLEIINLETGARQEVAHNRTFIGRPSWSPDGRWFAYMARRGSSGYDLYVHDTHNGQIRRITGPSFAPSWLSWSPDSTRLTLLARSPAQRSRRRITPHIVDVERGLVAELSRHRALYLTPPIWQPK